MVRAGAQRKEEPRGGGAGEWLGRAVLATLVLASEASFCLSRAQPSPGKRKGGRKEQEKEIKEKGGGDGCWLAGLRQGSEGESSPAPQVRGPRSPSRGAAARPAEPGRGAGAEAPGRGMRGRGAAPRR